MNGRFHSLSRTLNSTELPIPNCSAKIIFNREWNEWKLESLCRTDLILCHCLLCVYIHSVYYAGHRFISIICSVGNQNWILSAHTDYVYTACAVHGSFVHPLILMWSVWKITLNLFSSILPYKYHKQAISIWQTNFSALPMQFILIPILLLIEKYNGQTIAISYSLDASIRLFSD